MGYACGPKNYASKNTILISTILYSCVFSDWKGEEAAVYIFVHVECLPVLNRQFPVEKVLYMYIYSSVFGYLGSAIGESNVGLTLSTTTAAFGFTFDHLPHSLWHLHLCRFQLYSLQWWYLRLCWFQRQLVMLLQV